MPIYEYKCNGCGETQEVLHKTTQVNESIKCSNCGSGDLIRLISAANVSMGGTYNKGKTCCGKDERCDSPPCADGETCRRD
jgi:putative FmdB family regulatory protein